MSRLDVSTEVGIDSEAARQAHPNTVFYVVKIGFAVAETLAQLQVNS